MIVCICNNVSEHKIRQAVDTGAVTMPQLRDELGIGTCCGRCHIHAKQVLRQSLIEVAEERECAAMLSSGAAMAA